MTLLDRIRKGENGILALGNHPGIIQSMLDFDYLAGKTAPSIVAIVTGGRSAQKHFWGTKEILIPCVNQLTDVPSEFHRKIRFMANFQSGRRAAESTHAFFDTFPNALGGTIFAENVPERHATELIERYEGKKLITGPASVGFLVGGSMKLGAIGGVDARQIADGGLTEAGTVAVISTSGGMTNELMNGVSRAGKRFSFCAAIGGDRFPVTSLTELLQLAEEDIATKALVYFGELGGEDEYEIVELMQKKKFTKPILAYIAGVIDEAFDERMQFGHAKALARTKDESARAKREALRRAGALAPDTFPEFLREFKKLPGGAIVGTAMKKGDELTGRTGSILSTRKITDVERAPVYIKGKKLAPRKETYTTEILSALLGRKIKSPVTIAFADAIFSLLIDHGGNVSGAVNTMITARAGKDMVSSLASGLLTIGPRFGGAINDAAKGWMTGVQSGEDASLYVEQETKAGRIIPGIGHRKYRVGIPDPRVLELSKFATLLKKHRYYTFARAIEKVTTAKKGTLILNVDGVIASLFLDILIECEGYKEDELRELIQGEFFNALFVIPRTVGFIAHFLEQKKNDEGLFRLPDNLLFTKE